MPARVSAHFANQVDAVPIGQLSNPAQHVIRSGIERHMGSHCAGKIQSLGVEVAGENERGAGGTSHAHGKASDWSAAQHQHGTARNIGLQHGVDCVAQRIHDGSDLSRDAVQLHHVGGRHHDIIGKGSVPVYTDDLGPATEVSIAEAALKAMAADDVPLCGDEIAHPEQAVGACAGTQLGDFSGELMAYSHWKLESVTGPAVPFPDVKVGAADASVMNLDQGLACAADRSGHLPQDDSWPSGLLHQRAHGDSGLGRGDFNLRTQALSPAPL